ncbi:unnamed protein product [Moneuplotes crassus]|uniref:Uncharacterized protein n=1 Tax=Euplotes crassus TaxID=5936 RepID=A0AAD1U6Q9_EUPCR|nr:unnamed protein product [Moneuplotes crassus]
MESKRPLPFLESFGIVCNLLPFYCETVDHCYFLLGMFNKASRTPWKDYESELSNELLADRKKVLEYVFTTEENLHSTPSELLLNLLQTHPILLKLFKLPSLKFTQKSHLESFLSLIQPLPPKSVQFSSVTFQTQPLKSLYTSLQPHYLHPNLQILYLDSPFPQNFTPSDSLLLVFSTSRFVNLTWLEQLGRFDLDVVKTVVIKTGNLELAIVDQDMKGRFEMYGVVGLMNSCRNLERIRVVIAQDGRQRNMDGIRWHLISNLVYFCSEKGKLSLEIDSGEDCKEATKITLQNCLLKVNSPTTVLSPASPSTYSSTTPELCCCSSACIITTKYVLNTDASEAWCPVYSTKTMKGGRILKIKLEFRHGNPHLTSSFPTSLPDQEIYMHILKNSITSLNPSKPLTQDLAQQYPSCRPTYSFEEALSWNSLGTTQFGLRSNGKITAEKIGILKDMLLEGGPEEVKEGKEAGMEGNRGCLVEIDFGNLESGESLGREFEGLVGLKSCLLEKVSLGLSDSEGMLEIIEILYPLKTLRSLTITLHNKPYAPKISKNVQKAIKSLRTQYVTKRLQIICSSESLQNSYLPSCVIF